MMRYLDSSVLVSSLIPDDPDYAACDRLLVGSGNWTSPHALNEVFATLTGGRLGICIDAGVAARMIREVSALSARAEQARKTLPTVTIDTEIRFASPGDRAAFTAELAASVTALAARYHDESTDGGRWHRLIVAAHPRPAEPAATTVDIDPAPTDPDHDPDPEKG